MPTTNANGGGYAIHRAGTDHGLGARITAIGPWLGQAGLPFLLVAYLGLTDGGYDEIVRGEVGVAAWWVVLLGVASAALPARRIGRSAWIGIGLLGAFAAWTALGIGWSESAERSVTELGRVATLLGVFVLCICVQGPDGLRRAVGGVAAGIVVVAGVAALSRMQPNWFPELETPALITGSQARLHYPLDYWNGLAAFVALGVPLLLALASGARSLAVRALAAGVLPLLGLTAYLTLSRGGALAVVLAACVLVALHPSRLRLLAYTVPSAIGAAILMAAVAQRPELSDGLTGGVARSQGDELMAMTVVVCLGCGLIAAAIALADRHEVGPRIRVSPFFARRAMIGLGALAVAGLLAVSASGVPADAWSDFKNPEVPTSEAERFNSANGSGRYQFWSAAVAAGETEPLTGIGPGTYEFFWAREGSLPTFLRDAHSLYLETFAELGAVGLILIVGAVGAPLVLGSRRLLALDRERRVFAAGAVAACAAFAFSAAIEWVWELTVIPVAFLVLAAALLARSDEAAATGRSVGPRLVLGGFAAAALVAVAIPMASTSAIRDSQAAVNQSDLSAALGDARSASDLEPFAATPNLQQALVLELRGDLGAAVLAARAATDDEPTNWQTWLALSRLEARSGNADASLAAYRKARSLNPRSPLFAR